jgi:hypothetical protein
VDTRNTKLTKIRFIFNQKTQCFYIFATQITEKSPSPGKDGRIRKKSLLVGSGAQPICSSRCQSFSGGEPHHFLL